MSLDLTNTVATLLATAGWSPSRRVETRALAQELARRGYDLDDDDRVFFRALAGLEVQVPSPSSLNPGRTSTLTLDPVEAASCCSLEQAELWGAKFSDTLVPLACWSDDASVIMLGRNGAIYSVYDQDVAYLGSGAAGLEQLLFGRGAVEVR